MGVGFIAGWITGSNISARSPNESMQYASSLHLGLGVALFLAIPLLLMEQAFTRRTQKVQTDAEERLAGVAQQLARNRLCAPDFVRVGGEPTPLRLPGSSWKFGDDLAGLTVTA